MGGGGEICQVFDSQKNKFLKTFKLIAYMLLNIMERMIAHFYKKAYFYSFVM